MSESMSLKLLFDALNDKSVSAESTALASSIAITARAEARETIRRMDEQIEREIAKIFLR